MTKTTEAKTPTRIYKIQDADSMADAGAYRLVRAATPAQAVRHVTRERFIANVASQDDLVELLGHGLVVEVAGDEAA